MRKEMWQALKRLISIFAGCLLLAAAYNLVFDPNRMVTGGVSGLGIVLKEMTRPFFPGGVPLWLSTLILNVPIYLAGWLVRGRRFVMSSLLGTVLLSLALFLVPSVNIVEGDRVLASIFGGVFGGAGTALVLGASASTGGTDMLGLVITRYVHGYNVASVIGFLDGLVVLTGTLVFGLPSTMYAILAVIVMSRVSDLLLTGQKDARMIYCISDANEEIARDIMEQEGRGVSGLRIKGMFTGESRNMLMCVVGRRQIVPVKKIIRERDPRAFVIISNVSDVRGEGFAADILEN